MELQECKLGEIAKQEIALAILNPCGKKESW